MLRREDGVPLSTAEAAETFAAAVAAAAAAVGETGECRNEARLFATEPCLEKEGGCVGAAPTRGLLEREEADAEREDSGGFTKEEERRDTDGFSEEEAAATSEAAGMADSTSTLTDAFRSSAASSAGGCSVTAAEAAWSSDELGFDSSA